MIRCEDLQVFDGNAVLLEWDPIGEITGFADGTDSVSIEFDDSIKNELMVDAAGVSGTIAVNNKTMGKITVKLQVGSAMRSVLQDSWFNNRVRRGAGSFTDTNTGENYEFGCMLLEGPAKYDRGSKVPDNYEFVFLFAGAEYTPADNARTAIGNR